jgi:hypothetical protein
MQAMNTFVAADTVEARIAQVDASYRQQNEPVRARLAEVQARMAALEAELAALGSEAAALRARSTAAAASHAATVEQIKVSGNGVGLAGQAQVHACAHEGCTIQLASRGGQGLEFGYPQKPLLP